MQLTAPLQYFYYAPDIEDHYGKVTLTYPSSSGIVIAVVNSIVHSVYAPATNLSGFICIDALLRVSGNMTRERSVVKSRLLCVALYVYTEKG